MKLCFNCLRRNHAVAQCKNPAKCRNCGLKHHSTLCKKLQPGKERETSADEKVSINNIVPVSIDNAETAISARATSKANILPTAIMKFV